MTASAHSTDRDPGRSLRVLTGEDLRAVNHAIEQSALKSERNERGHSRTRIPFGSRALIQLSETPDEPLEAMPVDVSATGIGLVLGCQLAKAQSLSVVLYNRKGRPVSIGASVAWCSDVSKGLFLVGLQFQSPIDPNEYLDRHLIGNGRRDPKLAELATWLYALASRLRSPDAVTEVREELGTVLEELRVFEFPADA